MVKRTIQISAILMALLGISTWLILPGQPQWSELTALELLNVRGGTLPDCSSTCYTNVDTNCPSYVDANCAALYHCNASGVCYDGYYPSTGSYPNGTFWNVACWPTGTVGAGNAVPNSKDCAKEFYCQAECVRNPLTYFCVQGDYSGTTSHPTPQYRQYGAACGGS